MCHARTGHVVLDRLTGGNGCSLDPQANPDGPCAPARSPRQSMPVCRVMCGADRGDTGQRRGRITQYDVYDLGRGMIAHPGCCRASCQAQPLTPSQTRSCSVPCVQLGHLVLRWCPASGCLSWHGRHGITTKARIIEVGGAQGTGRSRVHRHVSPTLEHRLREISDSTISLKSRLGQPYQVIFGIYSAMI